MLNTDLFVKVNESGSSNALRRAALGNLFGFNLWAANNTPAITTAQADVATGTITNAAAAGATGSQACTVTGYVATIGEWFVVAGNDQPQFITATTNGSGNTTAVTANEAVKNATGAGAAVTVFKKFQAAASYAAGYSKEIAVDGYTLAPIAGRMLAIGTGANRRNYHIIEAYTNPSNASETLILLDRPLEFAITNNDDLFPGPSGEFNLAFHKNALCTRHPPVGPASEFSWRPSCGRQHERAVDAHLHAIRQQAPRYSRQHRHAERRCPVGC